MSDRLTAEPGTLESLRQLLEIAKESDHPMDKALTEVLPSKIKEVAVQNSQKKLPDWLLAEMNLKQSDRLQQLINGALCVWNAWHQEHMSLPRQIQRLRCFLVGIGVKVPEYPGGSPYIDVLDKNRSSKP